MTEADGTITLDVTVTNTGSVAGKDAVQVYFNPPYTDGGIEKASANLVTFGKTDSIEPGASQTLTLTFNTEDMASFDSKDKAATCWKRATISSASTRIPTRCWIPRPTMSLPPSSMTSPTPAAPTRGCYHQVRLR